MFNANNFAIICTYNVTYIVPLIDYNDLMMPLILMARLTTARNMYITVQNGDRKE